MADPKTNGPDSYRLLESANAALGVCEIVLPERPCDEDLAAANEAVDRAVPHLETRIAEELSERLARVRGRAA